MRQLCISKDLVFKTEILCSPNWSKTVNHPASASQMLGVMKPGFKIFPFIFFLNNTAFYKVRYSWGWKDGLERWLRALVAFPEDPV